MELLDVTGYTQSFVEAVENDDLDLQLVNLHAVEQYGGQVDAVLLGQEWLSHVHFQYDEYGHALTNLRQGLIPPLAGAYNNFFTDCMGAPIRSGPYSGNPCTYLPVLKAASASSSDAVFAPWPPRPCHLISTISFILTSRPVQAREDGDG